MRPPPARPVPGFSLVTVAALGALTMAWLFAISAAILPMYQRAAVGRFQTVLRSSAEAALDYAVAELNAAVKAGAVSPIDDTSEDGTPRASWVPAAALNNSGAQAAIQVNNFPAPAWSILYDPLKDPQEPNSYYAGQPNKWRTVTATAWYAGLKKSIVVVLEPVSEAQSLGSSGSQGQAGSAVPYFSCALFSRDTLTLSDAAKTDGYDSRNGPYGGSNIRPTGGDVATNKTVAIYDSARVGGDVKVFSKPLASLTDVVATSVPGATISDQLVINGMPSGWKGTPGPAASPGDNVLGMDRPLLPPESASYNPLLVSQSNAQLNVPTAPTASSEAISIGSLSVSGTQTLMLPPGDYKVNSINVTGNGKILMVPDASGNYGPLRLYVEGSSSGANAVQITGPNGIVNPTQVPGNLQIWYNGSKRLLLAGSGNLYGVVYAPNARIRITGAGNYFGAITGKIINNTGTGSIHFDLALKESGSTWGLTYRASSAPAESSSGTGGLFTGYRTISWQEL